MGLVSVTKYTSTNSKRAIDAKLVVGRDCRVGGFGECAGDHRFGEKRVAKPVTEKPQPFLKKK